MNETENTTETEVKAETERRYGIDVKPIQERYDEAVQAAEATLRETLDKLNVPIEAIDNQLAALFGRYSNKRDHVMSLLRLLTQEERRTLETSAYKALHEATEKAEEERNAALAADPFTNYLNKTVRRDYDWHTRAVLNILPATVDELKKLADEQGFCTSFEEMAYYATKRGYVDMGTFEHVKPVWWDVVPSSLNPERGQEWELVLQLPAYMRPHKYDAYELINYSVSHEFRQVVKEQTGEQGDNA